MKQLLDSFALTPRPGGPPLSKKPCITRPSPFSQLFRTLYFVVVLCVLIFGVGKISGQSQEAGVSKCVWGCGGVLVGELGRGGADDGLATSERRRKFRKLHHEHHRHAQRPVPNPRKSLPVSIPLANMSREKRPAADAFGSSQLVKRAKSDANLGESNAVAVVNGTAQNGALIQGVCLF